MSKKVKQLKFQLRKYRQYVRLKQEIINLLNENDIGYLINRTGRFSKICPDGIYSPTSNNLYVKDEYIEYMIESGKSSIVVIHEAIHKLQKLSLPEQAYQGIPT